MKDNFWKFIDSINKKKHDSIFLFCLLFMFIDHLGAYFYPGIIGFRVIGRIGLLCWPLMISQGLRYSGNKMNYIKSIFWVVLVTQIPWMMIHQDLTVNDLFYLLVSGLLILFYDQRQSFHNHRQSFHDYLKSFYHDVLFIFLFLFYFFYTFYFSPTLILFLILPICLYYRCFYLSVIFVSVYFFYDPLQFYSLLGILFLAVVPELNFTMTKKFKYAVYPAHYFVIAFLSVYF